LWYRISEHEVVCMLQEYLHIRYRHIPGVCVWHWQVLPSHANINMVGSAFDHAGLYPSWSGLLRYGRTGVGRAPSISRATLLHSAGRLEDDPSMCSEYGRGIISLWIGEEVFFAVECKEDEKQKRSTLANLRLPEGLQELPPWVVPLLSSICGDGDVHGVTTNIQQYLKWFTSVHSGAPVRLLRSIHWAALPLIWHPLFITNIPTRTNLHESADAQARLVKSVTAVWEDAEITAEAIELLNGMTGVSI
jgi:hypothetical protein